jgi:hypothetical protein
LGVESAKPEPLAVAGAATAEAGLRPPNQLSCRPFPPQCFSPRRSSRCWLRSVHHGKASCATSKQPTTGASALSFEPFELAGPRFTPKPTGAPLVTHGRQAGRGALSRPAGRMAGRECHHVPPARTTGDDLAKAMAGSPLPSGLGDRWSNRRRGDHCTGEEQLELEHWVVHLLPMRSRARTVRETRARDVGRPGSAGSWCGR